MLLPMSTDILLLLDRPNILLIKEHLHWHTDTQTRAIRRPATAVIRLAPTPRNVPHHFLLRHLKNVWTFVTTAFRVQGGNTMTATITCRPWHTADTAVVATSRARSAEIAIAALSTL